MENLATFKKVRLRRIADPEVARVVTNKLEKSQEALKRKMVQRTEAFLESEARYKALVENIPEVVYTILPDGTFTFMNGAIEKITGFKPVEFYRDKNLWIKQVHPEDRKKVLKQLSELRNGVALRREYRFVHKNGVDVIWFIDNAVPNIDKKGHFASADGVMIDMTEKRKMCEQLLQAEKMAALGTLSGGIAHEYNNLHTIILSSLQLAIQNKKLPGDVKTYLKDAFRTTCRLSDLTSQLLYFARKKPLKRERVNIKKIIEETLKIVRNEFQSEGINIVTVYSKNIPKLFVDPGQMSQVFLNIMINAKHAMLKSKEKRLTIELGRQNDTVYVAFSDAGCGIEEEAIPKLFEPFYTTKGSFCDGTYEKKIPGTGLGLSVSDSIVREHGGRIEVKSKANIGSTFTILLPIRQVDIEVQQKENRREKYGSIKGAKILVLDDEPGIRRILKNIFENKGCIVSACESGDTAIEEINKNEPCDLAIIDLQLPGLNGYGFIKEINHIPSHRRPEKMVLTGKLLSSENIKVLRKLGVYDIISKPFDNNVLYEKVCAALSHSKQ